MSIQNTMSVAGQDFEKALAHLKDEYNRLQLGRANSALVENIIVDAYGSTQPLKGVASVSVPDPRTLQIQPWDKAVLGPIEKAISVSGLGLNPVNDGVCIRISIPALTQERRLDLVKVVKKLAEEAKIGIRTSRQDAHNGFKQLKADSAITEDELHTADKQLQAKVDEYNQKVDELAKSKEQDVMTV